MNKSFFSKVLIVVIALLVAFSSAFAGPDKGARKAFEAQNFNQAVSILVEKLMKKNNHQDNIRLMEKCLKNAFKKGIRDAEDAESQGDLDKAVKLYRQLKVLDNKVMFLEVIKETKIDGKKKKGPYNFEVPNISTKLNELESGATESHYASAVKLQEAGSWKDAAIGYRHAREYDQNYKESAARYDECREKATLRIAVMPFEDISGISAFGTVNLQITEQVVSTALNLEPEFLQFITRDYLNQLLAEQGMQQSQIIDKTTATSLGKQMGIHAFIFGKVLSIVQNYPSESTTSGTSNSYYYKDKVKVPIKAVWTKHTNRGSVEIKASYQIVGVETGTIMSAETETRKASQERKWVTCRGNKDALGRDVLSHNTDPDVHQVDPPQVLAQDAITKLSSGLASKLVAFFN